MILVDTSVWIDHLRQTDQRLSVLLVRRKILGHPFVIGELALGSLKQRDVILDSLRGLPSALVASDDEVQAYIDRHALFGLGIGYVDAHLLAATALTVGAKIWTRDRRLNAAADRVGVSANLTH
ncbi:type II toxin-antitoxin system VapC family toxin [Acetobacter sacchari]|uniref:Ribonuclease VapC n=1 Tax=Acetobacter sacchari TaxID=2661687 RepID=A0ABS3M0C3_9PROT|nr:type II toxin-antitoxin system VapC family toxin [Acetobacter sacchari]MBO1361604.1 type II toxin-antitoxin system VapC family toxin [Acetobacter sacchari]